MKDHPERKGRLQLIEAMFAGHSWQEALTLSQLHVSRATAYLCWPREASAEKREGFISSITSSCESLSCEESVVIRLGFTWLPSGFS
jgi:hypothetical protein